MRVAWFHPTASDADVSGGDVRPLVDELRRTHAIDLIDEPRAHEFLWRHAQEPYDACVYELADTPAHQYVWPYLLRIPGIVALRAASLRESRTLALTHEQRDADYRAELAFGGRPMLRAPLSAARLVVVFDAATAQRLEHEYPGVRIAVAPVGVGPAPAHPRTAAPAHLRTGAPAHLPVRLGVLEGTDLTLVERAARRAREAGAAFDLVTNRPLEETIAQSDAVIALEWPPTGAPPTGALVAMASGLPVIVLETETTAAWPALDPQTWQPRDVIATGAPAVISLDPRDDEHSLVLAMRRVSGDGALRAALGTAADAWWRAHAAVSQAAAAWRQIFERAATLDAPPHPAGWPAHLSADGTGRAREILGEFDVAVDIFDL